MELGESESRCRDCAVSWASMLCPEGGPCVADEVAVAGAWFWEACAGICMFCMKAKGKLPCPVGYAVGARGLLNEFSCGSKSGVGSGLSQFQLMQDIDGIP